MTWIGIIQINKNKTFQKALDLIKLNIFVYPISPNSKIPLKGSNGYKDSSIDSKKIGKWFKLTANNLAIDLERSNLLVLDIDVGHNNKINGKSNLLEITDKYGSLPNDTLIEETPNGGLHYFFKIPNEMKVSSKISAFFENSGIDILTKSTISSPSRVENREYKCLYGNCTSIKNAPQWILDYLHHDIDKRAILKHDKNYTGSLLDELVTGATEGKRNNWFASITGKMLYTGAELKTIYILLHLINQNFSDPSLPDEEIDSIFKSIVEIQNKNKGTGN